MTSPDAAEMIRLIACHQWRENGESGQRNRKTTGSARAVSGLGANWVQHWKCDCHATTMRIKPGLGHKA